MSISQRAVKLASKPSWLDKAGDRLSATLTNVVERSPRTRRVAQSLHGAWLGHPLHPPLTDVPVGAWVVAGVLDAASLAGQPHLKRYAGYATAIGVIGALPTAAAGAMDWRSTNGEARRIGVSHALLNGGALGCYCLSLLCRIAGRGPARPLGFLGLGLASAGAFLGGHLVTVLRVGVKHEAAASGPSSRSEGVALAALTEARPYRIEIDGYPIVLVRSGSSVHAFADVCPHMGCSLAEGTVEDWAIKCPCHGSAFDLFDGSVKSGPSAFPVDTLRTEVRDGRVYVMTDSEE